MLKFILGMVLGFVAVFVLSDVVDITVDSILYGNDKYCATAKRGECYKDGGGNDRFKEDYVLLSKLRWALFDPTIGLKLPLTNRCWGERNIKYFGCNKVQIWLNKLIN